MSSGHSGVRVRAAGPPPGTTRGRAGTFSCPAVDPDQQDDERAPLRPLSSNNRPRGQGGGRGGAGSGGGGKNQMAGIPKSSPAQTSGPFPQNINRGSNDQVWFGVRQVWIRYGSGMDLGAYVLLILLI